MPWDIQLVYGRAGTDGAGCAMGLPIHGCNIGPGNHLHRSNTRTRVPG
ncbi:hypothetical protein CISG_07364 [Coccidioides immitis RMSCC 3703]|uniref:Uncharacterized protein n=1 Tax=Coccidioides immitis RMSCC 3703 TaxID=454286 RepID=A0A0J8TYK3_COCIT|nr:hypothetical protein CISG_07364 [Coccidioides immitis RMSCC 3703]